MSLTPLGILASAGSKRKKVTFLGSIGAPTTNAATMQVTLPNAGRLIIGWGSFRTNVTQLFNVDVTVNGSMAGVGYLGANFSFTGTAGHVQLGVGWHYADLPAGVHTVRVAANPNTGNFGNGLGLWLAEGYDNLSLVGFNRSNAAVLSSSFAVAARTHVIGYSAWKNNNNANGYRHSGASMKNAAAANLVIGGTLDINGRDWTGGPVEEFAAAFGSTTTTNTNRAQSFCYLHD